MARPRRENEPSSYQERPTVPPEMADRFGVVREILGDRLSISAAAEKLGIARVNMQTLVHRVEAAILEALTPRPSGPTPRPAKERELEAEVNRLRRETAKQKEQLQAMDDMLAAAGEIIRSLRGLPPKPSLTSSSARSPRTSKPKPPSEPEPEPEPPSASSSTAAPSSDPMTRALARIAAIPEHAERAARALGLSATTLRRWLGRLALGQPLRRRRGGAQATIAASTERAVRTHVRALAGMVGAASLAHTIVGVSRRAAAEIKRDELARMESERKAECDHVEVTTSGVVRGFDAMYLTTGFALIATDAHVAYRTTACHVSAYNANTVAEVLADDFRRNGPPLVVRLDRASCHDAEPVVSVLEAFGVLALHGPPYHAQYYGQLERQNSEHRGWLELHNASDPWLEQMTIALNRLWRRPTLAWRTAEEVWNERPPLDDDRDELHHEVRERAARRRAEGVAPDLATRLAIEQALITRGYLRITTGRQVLCE